MNQTAVKLVPTNRLGCEPSNLIDARVSLMAFPSYAKRIKITINVSDIKHNIYSSRTRLRVSAIDGYPSSALSYKIKTEGFRRIHNTAKSDY
jgi:hypothetical protein